MKKKDSFQAWLFSEIERQTGNNNKIVIHDAILKFCDDLEKAAILSQLIYWCDKGKRPDGYIFKSYKEWHKETQISEHKVKKAISELKEMRILHTKKKKANGSPTLHYKLDRKAFKNSFFELLQNERENFKNGNLKNEETLTDITTENTTENTTQNTCHQEKNNISLANKEKPHNSNLSENNDEQFSSGDDNNKKDISESELEKSFNNKFWLAYPQKINKQTALEAWLKLNPSPELVDTILSRIELFKTSKQWTKNNGQYIPYPNNFLNQKRWEDKLTYEEDWME